MAARLIDPRQPNLETGPLPGIGAHVHLDGLALQSRVDSDQSPIPGDRRTSLGAVIDGLCSASDEFRAYGPAADWTWSGSISSGRGDDMAVFFAGAMAAGSAWTLRFG